MDSWVWSTRAKNYDHVKLLNKHLYLQSAPMKYSLVPNKSSLKKQNKTNVQVPLFCSIALPQLQSYVPYKEQIYYLHLQSSPLSYDPNYVFISCSSPAQWLHLLLPSGQPHRITQYLPRTSWTLHPPGGLVCLGPSAWCSSFLIPLSSPQTPPNSLGVSWKFLCISVVPGSKLYFSTSHTALLMKKVSRASPSDCWTPQS